MILRLYLKGRRTCTTLYPSNVFFECENNSTPVLVRFKGILFHHVYMGKDVMEYEEVIPLELPDE